MIYSPIRNSAGSSKEPCEKISVVDKPAKTSRIPLAGPSQIKITPKIPAPEIVDLQDPAPTVMNPKDQAELGLTQKIQVPPKEPTRIRSLKEIEREVEVIYQLEVAKEKPTEETPENPKTPRMSNKTVGADVSMDIDEDPVCAKSNKKPNQNNRTTHKAINIVETPVASRPVESDESFKNLKEKLKDISNDSSSNDDFTSDEENEKDKEPEKKKKEYPKRPVTPRNLTPLLNAEFPGISSPKSPRIQKTFYAPAPVPKSPARFLGVPENLGGASENSVGDAELSVQAPESPRRSSRRMSPAEEEIPSNNLPKLKVVLTSVKAAIPAINKITQKKQLNVTFDNTLNPDSGSDAVSPTMVNSLRYSFKNAGKPKETSNATFAIPKIPRRTIKNLNPVVANYLQISENKATKKKKQKRSLADESKRRTLFSHQFDDDDDLDVVDQVPENPPDEPQCEVAVQRLDEDDLLENPENANVEQEEDDAGEISGNEEAGQDVIPEAVPSNSPEIRKNPTNTRKSEGKLAGKKTVYSKKVPGRKRTSVRKKFGELNFLQKYGPILEGDDEEEEQEEPETTGVRRSKRGQHLRKLFFSTDPRAQDYALVYGVCNPREEKKKEKLHVCQKAKSNLELFSDSSSVKDIKNSINLGKKMSVSMKPRTKNSRKVKEVIQEEDEEEPETTAKKSKETKNQKQQQNKSRAAEKKRGQQRETEEPMVVDLMEQPEVYQLPEQQQEEYQIPVQETTRKTRKNQRQTPPEPEIPLPAVSETTVAETTRRTRQNNQLVPPESAIFSCSSNNGTMPRNPDILDIVKMRHENRGAPTSVYSEVFDTKSFGEFLLFFIPLIGINFNHFIF